MKMMFGGFEAGWAYAPMPSAASAAVPSAALHRRVRRVTPDCHRIGMSFVQRKSTLSASKPWQQVTVRLRSRTRAGCPNLAQMRSADADRVRKCLLFGVHRTCRGHHETDAFDPKQTLGPQS